jgi:hypothetical protein
MQHHVHSIRRGGRTWVHHPPGGLKGSEVGAATLGARTVSIRQGRRVINKEQLGVASGRHDRAVAPPKLQPTSDPATHLPVADNLTSLVVQDAAVARQRPPTGHGKDLAERCCPVSQWQMY